MYKCKKELVNQSLQDSDLLLLEEVKVYSSVIFKTFSFCSCSITFWKSCNCLEINLIQNKTLNEKK